MLRRAAKIKSKIYEYFLVNPYHMYLRFALRADDAQLAGSRSPKNGSKLR